MARHASAFTYNLQRNYPFRWFTPVTIIGGLLATAGFSVINLSSQGNTLTTIYTSDPQGTLGKDYFHHLPSFLSDEVKPSCQAAEIPVGNQFLTNNSAFTYTLTRAAVLQNPKDFSQVSNEAALIYNASPFSNCSVYDITLNFAGNERTPPQIALANYYGLTAQARIYCTIQDPSTSTSDFPGGEITGVNLTTSYDLIPSTVSIYSGFAAFTGRNATSQASLFWGESLLAALWINTTSSMKADSWDEIAVPEQNFAKGTVALSRNNSAPSDAITDANRFGILFRFISFNGDGSVRVAHETSAYSVADLSPGGSNARHPNVWHATDGFAKTFEATIMADLGQSASPAVKLLTDETILEQFSSNISNILAAKECCSQDINTMMLGLATSSYKEWTSTNVTGPLGVNPSVLVTPYLCQVPRPRPLGSLIVAVLIADLVFIQALWVVFKLVVDYYLGRIDPNAQSCEGHIAGAGATRALNRVSNQDLELRPLRSSLETGRESLGPQSAGLQSAGLHSPGDPSGEQDVAEGGVDETRSWQPLGKRARE